jgi:salicylate hydroxylase
VLDHSVSLSSIQIRRWQSGKLLGITPISKAWGEQYVIHRADLHRALYDRAVALPNVRVQTNSTVISVDFDRPAVEVRNRGWIKADVVLGADGIKSRIRKQLLGKGGDAVIPTGDAAYRFVLPRAVMENDPELRELIDRPGGTRWVGPGRHVMAYPIKRHQLYNMVMLHPDVVDSKESWTAMGTKEEMLAMYEGWEPLLQKLMRLVDSETVLEWKLCSHGSLDTWTKGSVALLGDACHPMLYVQPPSSLLFWLA